MSQTLTRQTGGLPKSIATVCLSGTLPDKLEAAAAARFDAVEIFESDLLTFEGRPRDIRRMAANLDLAIALFQPFRDFEAMPAPMRSRNLDRARRKFDVMGELGSDLLLVCSNTHPEAIDDEARAAADLAALAALATERDLRIGYEALAWGRHVRRWSQAWRIVEAAGHPACGLIVDSFHTLAIGDDPAGIAALPAERIFFVQLADAPRLDMDVLSWSRHFRNFPGQGDLAVDEFVRAVLATGYAGPLSLEIFNDEFRATPPRPNAVDGLRALITVEAEAGGTSLPAQPEIDGIAFLEFAVDAPARESLGATLGTLGFSEIARHRSKDVTLHGQGDVRLVLNAEPDSAASEHFIQHGTSVCAIALVVDDVGRTLARAERLLCPIWQERTARGERVIPALRAPDGMLIYLIGRDEAAAFWADDFHLDAAPSGPGAGLRTIDHIAAALRPDAMDRFVLFYGSLFGLVPTPTVDLPDRFGLIRSRALENPTGTLRMPLNVSSAKTTETGRFITTGAGPGIHHIAFATDDIEASLAVAKAHGFKPLPIAENYYADLEASSTLTEATIARLQDASILYDADPHGTFRHAYSPSVDERIFFEIVERKGYRGYGARNAPFRLAAQSRRAEPRQPFM